LNQAVTILIQALKILNQDMKTPDQPPLRP